MLGRELARQRLHPEPRGEVRVALGRSGNQMAGTKTPWVYIGQAARAVELEPNPGVRWLTQRVEQQRAGHPQVHEQKLLAGQLPDQVLPPAADPLDQRAAQPLLHRAGWLRPGPPGIEDLDLGDRPSL